jgi:predicted amidophosphoribosyltransferase
MSVCVNCWNKRKEVVPVADDGPWLCDDCMRELGVRADQCRVMITNGPQWDRMLDSVREEGRAEGMEMAAKECEAYAEEERRKASDRNARTWTAEDGRSWGAVDAAARIRRRILGVEQGNG